LTHARARCLRDRSPCGVSSRRRQGSRKLPYPQTVPRHVVLSEAVTEYQVSPRGTTGLSIQQRRASRPANLQIIVGAFSRRQRASASNRTTMRQAALTRHTSAILRTRMLCERPAEQRPPPLFFSFWKAAKPSARAGDSPGVSRSPLRLHPG
jgi:hypothetical protein